MLSLSSLEVMGWLLLHYGWYIGCRGLIANWRNCEGSFCTWCKVGPLADVAFGCDSPKLLSGPVQEPSLPASPCFVCFSKAFSLFLTTSLDSGLFFSLTLLGDLAGGVLHKTHRYYFKREREEKLMYQLLFNRKKKEEERGRWQISDSILCVDLNITEMTDNYRSDIYLNIPETSLLSRMPFVRDFGEHFLVTDSVCALRG